MMKSALLFVVGTLMVAGCGGSESPEPEASAPPAVENTVHAEACTVVTTTQPDCNTRDYFKLKASSYCPTGYQAVAVDMADACTTPANTYHTANITCCPR